MANQKISQYNELTTAADDDLFAIVDTSESETKKITFANALKSKEDSLTFSTGLTNTSQTITTNDSQIVHDNLSGFVANEHIDHTGVTFSAGSGITGGGDISANRSFALDINGLTEDTAIGATDTIPIYDGANKKIAFSDFEGDIDHTNILNIGTNSHSEIDTHIGSTSNPHSVTKAQVGLTNVTDNAQVKKISSSTDNNIPQWDGTTGDLLKDGLTVGTGANNLVQLDGSGLLPAVDGSQLTNLPSGFPDPMTTRGDIITRQSGGTDRLALGSLNQVLLSDGTDIVYSSSLANGWLTSGETWTYSSVDDPTGIITVPSDATTKYSPGMRIRFVNGGNTIYGLITAVTSTSITFLHEIDPTDSQALHLMANSSITSPYYSTQKAPFGFPLSPTKWTVKLVDSTSRSQASPTSDQWYNPGSLSINIPIGIWNIRFSCLVYAHRDSGGGSKFSSLSTANNSASDSEFTISSFIVVANADIGSPHNVEKVLDLSSKTTYYPIIKTNMASATTIQFFNAGNPLVVSCASAYL